MILIIKESINLILQKIKYNYNKKVNEFRLIIFAYLINNLKR